MELIDKEKLLQKLESCQADQFFNVASIRNFIREEPAVEPEEKPTIYGYNTKQLVMFAEACRENGVTNEDLNTFANNAEFAFNAIWKEQMRLAQNAIDRLAAEEDNG